MADNEVMAVPGVALTTDLSHDEAIPYFLWDDPMTMRDLRERLASTDEERVRLLGKILREARDSDVWLFTTPEEIDRRWIQLERHLGKRRHFWLFLLGQWREQGLLNDLVRDAAPQVLEKIIIGRLVLDSPREILANKLCALLSRTEVRDLVDVARLEQSGLDPIAALYLARSKDGEMSPAQLAWVLSEFPVTTGESSRYGMSQKELEDFRESRVRRLTAEAFPRS